MKRFLLQLIIFITPIIIFLCLPTYILWRSKENFYKIDNIISHKKKSLVGYLYTENNYSSIKWTYLKSSEAKCVWTLGSSRVLQFRENMFDSTFYNAGFTVVKINDFTPFLKSLPTSKHPKYLIMGLDQWMFNALCDDLSSAPSIESWKNSFTFFPKLFPTYYSIYDNLFTGKYALSAFNKRQDSFHRIGLNAVMNNTGLRNDGSIYYGGQITKLINRDPTAMDFKYTDTFNRIKQGTRPFQHFKSINEKALSELNDLLQYCKDHKINVIAFLPPYAEGVYNNMNESNNYISLEELFSRIKPFFRKYNYEVYDFSKLSSFDSNDNEVIDGGHGGEVAYQKILIHMLASGSILNRVTNAKRLRSDLANKKNNYIVYDY